MNLIHRCYCRSGRWRRRLTAMMPWACEDLTLEGQTVLEIGSGPGLSTEWLQARVGALIAAERNADDALALGERLPGVEVRHADGTQLPFVDASFDLVVCFTMLHHVPSAALQDRLFAEAARVLRPGGTFAGIDCRWGPVLALAHVRDTLCLVDPKLLPERLSRAGFAGVTVESRKSDFRFRAIKAAR